MGLAKGIFVVDTHVYAQRDVDVDNSEFLLYAMGKYDVDFCVLNISTARSNELNGDIAKRYPDKFIAACGDVQLQRKSQKGEVKWTIEDAVKEVEDCIATGLFKGYVGISRDRSLRKKMITWEERMEQICQYFELARKYKLPLSWHTGIPVGWAPQFDMARSRAHSEAYENSNTLLAHELASLYPDVPIILAHGGVEASGYFMKDYEECLNVAASHHNVFIETGMWWAELYERPLKDPNIGAKKLIWGTGWGQKNTTQAWIPGMIPSTYNAMFLDKGPATHQPDVWGWSLRELGRLNIPQDDLNLILGGNAAFLLDIKLPQPYERLFKPVERKYIK